MTEPTPEPEAWIRTAAITAVTKTIADLQHCGDADAPERLEFLQRLLTRLEEGQAK
jgi:hypothetical protein